MVKSMFNYKRVWEAVMYSWCNLHAPQQMKIWWSCWLWLMLAVEHLQKTSQLWYLILGMLEQIERCMTWTFFLSSKISGFFFFVWMTGNVLSSKDVLMQFLFEIENWDKCHYYILSEKFQTLVLFLFMPHPILCGMNLGRLYCGDMKRYTCVVMQFCRDTCEVTVHLRH